MLQIPPGIRSRTMRGSLAAYQNVFPLRTPITCGQASPDGRSVPKPKIG